MRFSVIGSGSKGNALVVQGGGRTVLIDVGFGPRELKRRMQHIGLDLPDIDAVLITHGHGDHTKGARQLSGALGIPTYATEETKRFCAGFTGLRNHVPIVSERPFQLDGLTVCPVATPHDAPGSVCFVLDDGDERLGVCSDLGVPTDLVATALGTCHALVLEFNHDVDMLRRGPYSAALKRRVGGPRGHLSNDQAASLLRQSMHPGLTRVLLSHLSEVNNTPALALASARAVVGAQDVELSVAPQHHPTGWLRAKRLAATTLTVEAAPCPVVAPAIMPPVGRHAALEHQLALFASRR